MYLIKRISTVIRLSKTHGFRTCMAYVSFSDSLSTKWITMETLICCLCLWPTLNSSLAKGILHGIVFWHLHPKPYLLHWWLCFIDFPPIQITSLWKGWRIRPEQESLIISCAICLGYWNDDPSLSPRMSRGYRQAYQIGLFANVMCTFIQSCAIT